MASESTTEKQPNDFGGDFIICIVDLMLMIPESIKYNKDENILIYVEENEGDLLMSTVSFEEVWQLTRRTRSVRRMFEKAYHRFIHVNCKYENDHPALFLYHMVPYVFVFSPTFIKKLKLKGRKVVFQVYTLDENEKPLILDVLVPRVKLVNLVKPFKHIEKHECHSCNKLRIQKLKLCTRCRKARYCDEECQRKNWKEHKKICKSYKIDMF